MLMPSLQAQMCPYIQVIVIVSDEACCRHLCTVLRGYSWPLTRARYKSLKYNEWKNISASGAGPTGNYSVEPWLHSYEAAYRLNWQRLGKRLDIATSQKFRTVVCIRNQAVPSCMVNGQGVSFGCGSQNSWVIVTGHTIRKRLFLFAVWNEFRKTYVRQLMYSR